jgi:hypothetical protein
METHHRAGSDLTNNNMFTETKTTTPVNKLPFVFEGISLRDYFAGQAMISMYGHSVNIAEEAYKVADAMLEARTKQDNE